MSSSPTDDDNITIKTNPETGDGDHDGSDLAERKIETVSSNSSEKEAEKTDPTTDSVCIQREKKGIDPASSSRPPPLGCVTEPKTKCFVPLSEALVTKLFNECQRATEITDDVDEAWRPLSELLMAVFSDVDLLCNSFAEESAKQLDIESLRRTFDLVFGTGFPYERTLSTALGTLCEYVQKDMMFRRDTFCISHPNYLRLFIILMELPFPVLHDGFEVESGCNVFCSLLLNLPVDVQADLVMFWSKQPPEWLLAKVLSIQQALTLVILMVDMRHTSDESAVDRCVPAITRPVRILRLMYLCSLIGALDQSSQSLANSSKPASCSKLDESGTSAASASDSNWCSLDMPPIQVELTRRCGQPISEWTIRQPLVEYDEFVNQVLSDKFNVEQHYVDYKRLDVKQQQMGSSSSDDDDEKPFTFFPHYAFVLSGEQRLQFMWYENRVQMSISIRHSFLSSLQLFLPEEALDRYLTINVRRSHLLQDAVLTLSNKLSENKANLRKQLRIKFEGEPGVDEGGVAKEFYQLIMEQLFNVDYAMFLYNDKTRLHWFNSVNEYCGLEYRLIGILLGLAVYNHIIVDVHFPDVIFRKLFDQSVALEDLQQVDPEVHSSLKQLLEHPDNDVEEVFGMNFMVGFTDVFGSTHTHELCPNGANRPVNNDNRKEFVELYANYLLTESVAQQFNEFYDGFHLDLDMHALEQITKYDGFEESDTTVSNFWSVVHGMSQDEQRLLLKFATGCDRAPMGGLQSVEFIIVKNGDKNDARLPTAHTCFNVLILPDYETKDILKERLLKAINNCTGFGLQ